ncbi:MAG TPA: DUF1360 domain-containing protein [Actinocrinis sp.]|jgi:hypothetical protein
MSDVRHETSQVGQVKEALHGVEREYAHGEDFPLYGYVGAMAAYGAVVSALGIAAKLTRRSVPTPSVWDVALCAGATHRLSRLLAKDPVTSPLRAPFTRFEGTQGPAELREEVRGTGARKTIGEMVTCPFCIGMWISTALSAGLVFAPAVTRLAAGGLTALTVSDFLHFARGRVAG